jgi:hypothetical protein
MNVRSGFLEFIGNTPLIRLRAASDITGCDIYGKAEFLNPTTAFAFGRCPGASTRRGVATTTRH